MTYADLSSRRSARIGMQCATFCCAALLFAVAPAGFCQAGDSSAIAAGPSRGGKPPPSLPESPPARYWHAMDDNGSEVPDASRLYVFGGDGADQSPVASDLWYYSTTADAWRVAATNRSRPDGRKHPGLSCGAGRCLLFGGVRLGPLGDTWVYQEAQERWSKFSCKRRSCPSARWGTAIAYDPSRFYHVAFGGIDQQSLGDTFTFSSGRWTTWQPTTAPSRRDRAAAEYAEGAVKAVVIHGGQADNSEVLCDMFAWTGSDWQEIELSANSESPPCLHSHSIVWDGSQLVVTGGYLDTGNAANDKVWNFSFDSSTSGSWHEDTTSLFAACVAGADDGARLIRDRASQETLSFGGFKPGGEASDKMVLCELP